MTINGETLKQLGAKITEVSVHFTGKMWGGKAEGGSSDELSVGVTASIVEGSDAEVTLNALTEFVKSKVRENITTTTAEQAPQAPQKALKQPEPEYVPDYGDLETEVVFPTALDVRYSKAKQFKYARLICDKYGDKIVIWPDGYNNLLGEGAWDRAQLGQQAIPPAITGAVIQMDGGKPVKVIDWAR